ncbi:MAG: glycine cleavage system protein GcvH [Thalassobaculaceae bacterium]
MTTLRFSEDHEWVAVDGDTGIVGITHHAQEQLGDIVFVELPEIGRQLAQGEECAVVESVKAASELYAPVSGEVIAVNETLIDAPETVNSAPDGDGWFFKIKVTAPDELTDLMDADGYAAFIAT